MKSVAFALAILVLMPSALVGGHHKTEGTAPRRERKIDRVLKIALPVGFGLVALLAVGEGVRRVRNASKKVNDLQHQLSTAQQSHQAVSQLTNRADALLHQNEMITSAYREQGADLANCTHDRQSLVSDNTQLRSLLEIEKEVTVTLRAELAQVSAASRTPVGCEQDWLAEKGSFQSELLRARQRNAALEEEMSAVALRSADLEEELETYKAALLEAQKTVAMDDETMQILRERLEKAESNVASLEEKVVRYDTEYSAFAIRSDEIEAELVRVARDHKALRAEHESLCVKYAEATAQLAACQTTPQ